jgi:predicted membrane channel-forming protein YqfA (hemolysin III family)
VTKQWFQIIGIWVLVAVAGTGAFLLFEVEFRFLVFSSIAAAAIAVVSIEHLISSKAKDTVRQQVYVSAGTFALLAILTMLSLNELDF